MGINNGKSGKAVSVAGIEALFSEFEALYGVRFADMWRGTDIAYVLSLIHIFVAKGLKSFCGTVAPVLPCVGVFMISPNKLPSLSVKGSGQLIQYSELLARR